MGRVLEIVTVGTAVAVGVTIGLILILHLTDDLRAVAVEIGTFPASLLFGYLWLLTLVGASQLTLEAAAKEGAYRTQFENGAIAGIGISLVYLTVVFIIGFVASGPAALDPANHSVFLVVGAGVVVGALAGLFVVAFVLAVSQYTRQREY